MSFINFIVVRGWIFGFYFRFSLYQNFFSIYQIFDVFAYLVYLLLIPMKLVVHALKECVIIWFFAFAQHSSTVLAGR